MATNVSDEEIEEMAALLHATPSQLGRANFQRAAELLRALLAERRLELIALHCREADERAQAGPGVVEQVAAHEAMAKAKLPVLLRDGGSQHVQASEGLPEVLHEFVAGVHADHDRWFGSARRRGALDEQRADAILAQQRMVEELRAERDHFKTYYASLGETANQVLAAERTRNAEERRALAERVRQACAESAQDCRNEGEAAAASAWILALDLDALLAEDQT